MLEYLPMPSIYLSLPPSIHILLLLPLPIIIPLHIPLTHPHSLPLPIPLHLPHPHSLLLPLFLSPSLSHTITRIVDVTGNTLKQHEYLEQNHNERIRLLEAECGELNDINSILRAESLTNNRIISEHNTRHGFMLHNLC